MLEVAAVIPANNEELRVGNVVRAALRSQLVDLLVVVDDGSTDSTAYAAEEAAAAEAESHPNKPYAVVANRENVGKTESIYTGVARAKDIGGSALSTLVFLDADSSPLWSRDTHSNMKLWQVPVTRLALSSREPLPAETAEGRSDVFVSLLARYIDELARPVKTGREDMRSGMYQRNVITDTIMAIVGGAGHAGNRAVSVRLWEAMMKELADHDISLDPWELEGALNAYTEIRGVSRGKFMMHGVVNVGSRVKAGSMFRGLHRMNEIHMQAFSGSSKVHAIEGSQGRRV